MTAHKVYAITLISLSLIAFIAGQLHTDVIVKEYGCVKKWHAGTNGNPTFSIVIKGKRETFFLDYPAQKRREEMEGHCLSFDYYENVIGRKIVTKFHINDDS